MVGKVSQREPSGVSFAATGWEPAQDVLRGPLKSPGFQTPPAQPASAAANRREGCVGLGWAWVQIPASPPDNRVTLGEQVTSYRNASISSSIKWV